MPKTNSKPVIYLASDQRADDAPRFTVTNDGKEIVDDDFIFDAMLLVKGDFASSAVRISYAHWIADTLNEADSLLPREPRRGSERGGK